MIVTVKAKHLERHPYDFYIKEKNKIFYKNSKNVGMAQKGQKQGGMSW